jgi:hypothetical protein
MPVGADIRSSVPKASVTESVHVLQALATATANQSLSGS